MRRKTGRRQVNTDGKASSLDAHNLQRNVDVDVVKELNLLYQNAPGGPLLIMKRRLRNP